MPWWDCEDTGALHLFQRFVQTPRPVLHPSASAGGVRRLWGRGAEHGLCPPSKGATSPAPGLACSQGHLATRTRGLGGFFGITASEFSPSPVEGLLSSWAKPAWVAQWGLHALGVFRGGREDVTPLKPGYPNRRGMLGARAEATSSGKRIPSPGRSISMATPRGHQHPAWTSVTRQRPQSPRQGCHSPE